MINRATVAVGGGNRAGVAGQVLTMPSANQVAMAEGGLTPRTPCGFCGRGHSARRGLCWRCYRLLRAGAVDGQELDLSLYGRAARVIAAIRLLTVDEAREVRAALGATG